jgi:hypothetical protein
MLLSLMMISANRFVDKVSKVQVSGCVLGFYASQLCVIFELVQVF